MTSKRMQIEADKRLLHFKTYEDYLDSLVSPIDLHYLRSTSTARKIVELGYRSTSVTLDRDTFYKRQKNIKAFLFPTWKPYMQDCELITAKNSLQNELSLREKSNRLGIISTIIFIRLLNNSLHDVSGYIDFADRLQNESWRNFYLRKKNQIIPRTDDLAFYNWRTEVTKINETENYQPMIDRKRGLFFKNLHDRKLIFVDPKISPGVDTTRLWVKSDNIEHIVIYDHFMRNR